MIFIGLDAWTGLGTFSLSIPGLPHVGSPTGAEFLWALAIGVLAVLLGSAIRWLGLFLRPHVEGRMLLAMPVVGLAIAGLAIAFAEATGKGSSLVLFSGQSALGSLVTHSASYTVGTLVLLIVCKGLAYGGSLSSFRGGPTFPAMFLGAAGGMALSHLPGLPLVCGVAMGIGAMTVVMLRLPLTSVLLATVLLASDGLAVTPLVIVAVVVAYVVSARLVQRRRRRPLLRRGPKRRVPPRMPFSPARRRTGLARLIPFGSRARCLRGEARRRSYYQGAQRQREAARRTHCVSIPPVRWCTSVPGVCHGQRRATSSPARRGGCGSRSGSRRE